MLKKDGILIYLICIFLREENEYVINEFISEYLYVEFIEMERLWFYKIKGEGYFVVKIKKLEEEECNVKELKIKNLDKEIKDYREFEKKFLKVDFYSNKKNKFYLRGENLYLFFEIYLDMRKLKVLRYGLYLGVLKKNRFEFFYVLFYYLKVEDVKNVENFSV